MATKIYAYGMDGFITPMMKFFAKEGSLPNFARFLREGTVNQTYPSFPVWTPTNWATLSTRAQDAQCLQLANHCRSESAGQQLSWPSQQCRTDLECPRTKRIEGRGGSIIPLPIHQGSKSAM